MSRDEARGPADNKPSALRLVALLALGLLLGASRVPDLVSLAECQPVNASAAPAQGPASSGNVTFAPLQSESTTRGEPPNASLAPPQQGGTPETSTRSALPTAAPSLATTWANPQPEVRNRSTRQRPNVICNSRCKCLLVATTSSNSTTNLTDEQLATALGVAARRPPLGDPRNLTVPLELLNRLVQFCEDFSLESEDEHKPEVKSSGQLPEGSESPSQETIARPLRHPESAMGVARRPPSPPSSFEAAGPLGPSFGASLEASIALDSRRPASPPAAATAAAAGAFAFGSGYLAHLRRQQLAKLQPVAVERPLEVPSNSTHQVQVHPQQLAQQLIHLPIEQVEPTTSLNMSHALSTLQTGSNSSQWAESSSLVNGLVEMLERLGEPSNGHQMDEFKYQALLLSHNNLSFELWSEIYALLATPMRQNLIHLDLSHNSLAKLGITFTGYLEHHMGANGSWPLVGGSSGAAGHAHAASNAYGKQPLEARSNSGALLATANELKASQLAKISAIPKVFSSRLKSSPLLAGGKLYSVVQYKFGQKLLDPSSQQWRHSQPEVVANATRIVAQSNELNYTTGEQPTESRLRDKSLKVAKSASELLQGPTLIRSLDLSHNKLKWLINDQFRALKYVQAIRLDHNRIVYVHQHAFNGLESLKYLNLNFNRLQVIYIEQFQTNYNLLALMLRSNYISYLRGGSFASLANLRRLDLSINKLSMLSNSAFLGLESLELLNCSSNQFIHAPSGPLHPLTNLRQLDLSNNLIAQLAPGSFFHLPIEELWLDKNEQLVSIERGAFWDLPHLRKLHLNSNPMLMSINSQTFVGTQKLKSIEVENCPMLDEGAKQLLENITIATTSRLLRFEQVKQQQQQQQQQQYFQKLGAESQNNSSTLTTNDTSVIVSSSGASSLQTQRKLVEENSVKKQWKESSNLNNSSKSSLTSSLSGPAKQTELIDDASKLIDPTQVQLSSEPNLMSPVMSIPATADEQQQLLVDESNKIKRIIELNSKRLRYVYYLGSLTLLVVALKLIFKYTSQSHYVMEARRRRRRVYEASTSVSKQLDGSSFDDISNSLSVISASEASESPSSSSHSSSGRFLSHKTGSEEEGDFNDFRIEENCSNLGDGQLNGRQATESFQLCEMAPQTLEQNCQTKSNVIDAISDDAACDCGQQACNNLEQLDGCASCQSIEQQQQQQQQQQLNSPESMDQLDNCGQNKSIASSVCCLNCAQSLCCEVANLNSPPECCYQCNQGTCDHFFNVSLSDVTCQFGQNMEQEMEMCPQDEPIDLLEQPQVSSGESEDIQIELLDQHQQQQAEQTTS